MHDLDILLDLIRQDEGVSVSLGLGEDDGLTFSSVADQHISKG